MNDPRPTFVKTRDAAQPGSIPDLLQMFPREVRFYRELAGEIDVRTPACYLAEEHDGATRLELEDLSGWREGADPEVAARLLGRLHRRFEGTAVERWPWLPRPDVSALVGHLYDRTWAAARSRSELTEDVRVLGDSLVGRVAEVEARAAASGPVTFVHGDASALNMRTSPAGEVALLDWEDYDAAPGVADLAWHLVSSVPPPDWERTIAAYGEATHLAHALPAASVQALLSWAFEDDPDDAAEWVTRLAEAARRI